MAGLLEQVPESLIDRVRLIDLADRTRAPGINLLDTRVFPDRDRTADSVVRVAKGLWEQWGPRMQSILEQTVKTLHEANEHPDTADDRQHTILDGLKLLSDNKYRTGVLKKVSDPYLLEWWARDFGGWHHQYRADALAPVQTRLSYYASSKRARAILGQPRSTIDLRETVLEGGILLVSTAQGAVGRDVSALVGASLLNLVDSVIREQESLPLQQRRGALVVVDEMQSLPGVDYESMLSELGKYGASFILATQSLAKLDDLSPTMRDTILANVGCLAVFQVAGNDARQLVWELGKERVTEDDVTSLDVHHCYVRATVGKERMPAFSMMVRQPGDGDPAIAERIRRPPSTYTLSDLDLSFAGADAQQKVRDFRDGAGEGRAGRRGGAMMRTSRCESEILRALAEMPFLDRLELAAVTGRSRGAVYGAVAGLEQDGCCQAVPHGTGLFPASERFHLTAAGLRRLAEQEGQSLGELLRLHPVSEGWRRILLERLDGVAAVYRLAAALSGLARPLQFRWYRAEPLDAALELAGGRTVGIVRRGRTSDRSPFANRMWKLRNTTLPGAVLALMPDAVRLRHARRMLDGFPVPVFLAVESEAVIASLDGPVWSPQAVNITPWPAPDPGKSAAGRRASRRSRSPNGPRSPATCPSPGRGGKSPTSCCPPSCGPPRSGPSTWCPTGPGFPSRTWPGCWASPASGPTRW